MYELRDDGAYELFGQIDDSGDEFEFVRGKERLLRRFDEETWENATTEMVLNQYNTGRLVAGHVEAPDSDRDVTEVAKGPLYENTDQTAEETEAEVVVADPDEEAKSNNSSP